MCRGDCNWRAICRQRLSQTFLQTMTRTSFRTRSPSSGCETTAQRCENLGDDPRLIYSCTVLTGGCTLTCSNVPAPIACLIV